MAGQSSQLTLEEARKIQIAIQAPRSQAKEASTGMSKENVCTRVKHQG